MQEEKRSAGRPRNKQYYHIGFCYIDVNTGKQNFGELTKECDKFPKRADLIEEINKAIPGSVNITIMAWSSFPIEEDYFNYKS